MDSHEFLYEIFRVLDKLADTLSIIQNPTRDFQIKMQHESEMQEYGISLSLLSSKTSKDLEEIFRVQVLNSVKLSD